MQSGVFGEDIQSEVYVNGGILRQRSIATNRIWTLLLMLRRRFLNLYGAGSFAFVIFFFRIYRPYRFYRYSRWRCGSTATIAVIMERSMLLNRCCLLRRYAPKVFYFVQEIFYLIEFVIAAEIRGVGLLTFYAYRIQDIVGTSDDPYLGRGSPIAICVKSLSDIFQKPSPSVQKHFNPYPYRIFVSLHQIGRPLPNISRRPIRTSRSP